MIPVDAAALAGALHLASPAALGQKLSNGAYVRARHIDYLSDRLVDVAMGDISRLMVLMPPRHSKSLTCCRWFPAWLLALRPHWEFLLGCYGDDFAREHGRFVRNVMVTHWPELGVSMSQDTKAGNLWRTADEGGMQTAGVGGTMTGRGGQILLLDDPTKNAEEAQSEAIQERNWAWWLSTFRTRLTPAPKDKFQGAIVVIGTCWDEGDLIGRLRKAHKEGPGAEGYEDWTIIKFPALATETDVLGREPGDALWPAMFPAASFATARNSPHWWAALYQQDPHPAGGDLIKERWWGYWVPKGCLAVDGSNVFGPVVVDGRACPVVELPSLDALHAFQSWDMNFKDNAKALASGRQPDPVAGHVWARDEADLFLLDREHGRFDLDETIAKVRELADRVPEAKVKLVEYTANGPAVIRTLRRELGGFVPVTPRGSKITRVIGDLKAGATEADKGARAISAQGFVKGGNCFLPHPAMPGYDWVQDFRHNLGRFPKAGKDDTDAFSQAWAYAQSDIWRAQNRAQGEVAEHNNEPPPRDLHELRRQQVREQLARERRGDDGDDDSPEARMEIYGSGRR